MFQQINTWSIKWKKLMHGSLREKNWINRSCMVLAKGIQTYKRLKVGIKRTRTIGEDICNVVTFTRWFVYLIQGIVSIILIYNFQIINFDSQWNKMYDILKGVHQKISQNAPFQHLNLIQTISWILLQIQKFQFITPDSKFHPCLICTIYLNTESFR
jgi:hypothetical protein